MSWFFRLFPLCGVLFAAASVCETAVAAPLVAGYERLRQAGDDWLNKIPAE